MLDSQTWRVELETERLRLVPQSPADAEEMARVLADPALHAFTGGAPLTVSELRARYERLAAGASPDGTEVWANWIVRCAGDGAAVGYVQASVGQAAADLAWVIGTAFQGQGYAAEAAAAMAAFLRAEGVLRLTAHVHPEHVASQRVAAAAGLARTGRNLGGEEVWSDAG